VKAVEEREKIPKTSRIKKPTFSPHPSNRHNRRRRRRTIHFNGLLHPRQRLNGTRSRPALRWRGRKIIGDDEANQRLARKYPWKHPTPESA
jgi:hypothetical protein